MLLKNKSNELYLVSKKYWNDDVPDKIAETKEYREKYINELLETSKKCFPSDIIDFILFETQFSMFDDEHEQLLKVLYERVSTLEKIFI